MSALQRTIVIGGGHNGLVCAGYLAKAGRPVLVLEAASRPGGAAVTHELAPGFKVSACAHIVHQLNSRVVADLDLARHGLRFSTQNMATVALDGDGRHIILASAKADTASLAAHSPADAAALPRLRKRLGRYARTLQPFLSSTPPRLGTNSWADRRDLLKLAWGIRRLGRDAMRELLRIGSMNVADLLEEEFETDRLRGALAFDAVLGTRLGPRSPGSVLTWLYRLAAESGSTGKHGGQGLALPAGGMGAVADALARAAAAAGAELRLDAPVARILVDGDRASGVVLESGEEIAAGTVISNADPHRTFIELLGAEHLDTGFVRRIKNIRLRGACGKLNLALDALPAFEGLAADRLDGRLLIAPDIDYLERAFNHAKYGESSEAPGIEITIPSLNDASLAPPGKHVLSAIVQYAPYDLKGGWDAAKASFADRVLDTIADYAPDLRKHIVTTELLTPLDFERDYGMTGGHWHHGELGFDQLFMLRPVPGAAQYATPMAGLYLCGAGAHPGGGVMGLAGMNAARQIMLEAAA
jgi:phytoene dehydrogenase-like protein